MFSGSDRPAIPPAVLAEFGAARARPRVARAYTELWGFRRVKRRPVITAQVALQLRAHGVSAVELVWRGRRIRMTVEAGVRSVWGAGDLPVMPAGDPGFSAVGPAA